MSASSNAPGGTRQPTPVQPGTDTTPTQPAQQDEPVGPNDGPNITDGREPGAPGAPPQRDRPQDA